LKQRFELLIVHT